MVLQTSVSPLANLCDNFLALFEVLATHVFSSKGLFICLLFGKFFQLLFDTVIQLNCTTRNMCIVYMIIGTI
jgi:hypothetical protein